MSTNLNYYRIWCVTENAYVTMWGTDMPTKCPNDTSDTIDLDSITIVETMNINKFIAEENTNGYFETTNFINEIPSGNAGDITTYDITWDSDITLWKTILSVDTTMVGDEIKVVAAPETTVGAITSQIEIGNTIINVTSTAIQYMFRGCECVLDDGVNKHVTSIIEKNSDLGTVTIKNPSPYSYSTGTLIKMGIYVIKYIKLINLDPVEIGGKGIKGKDIKKGTVLRIYYTNNNGSSKTVYWRPEYYNNG